MGDQHFARYFFVLYHWSPDEQAGINELRKQLRSQYPRLAIPIGARFVLQGEPDCQALAGYYQALQATETLSDEFREYATERMAAITEARRQSQSLPVPVNLTEGQLAQDFRLEFLTCVALRNGQVAME